MKKSIIHNKGIYGEIREIRKADLAFELDSNSKAQQNIERDVPVISALVCQGLCKKVCQALFFHKKDDVVN